MVCETRLGLMKEYLLEVECLTHGDLLFQTSRVKHMQDMGWKGEGWKQCEEMIMMGIDLIGLLADEDRCLPCIEQLWGRDWGSRARGQG